MVVEFVKFLSEGMLMMMMLSVIESVVNGRRKECTPWEEPGVKSEAYGIGE